MDARDARGATPLMCMFHFSFLNPPFLSLYSDLNVRFPSQMLPVRAELKSFSIWSVLISSFSSIITCLLIQFSLPFDIRICSLELDIAPLPRSRRFRLRGVAHMNCVRVHERVLAAPFSSASPNHCFPLSFFSTYGMARAMAPPTPRPTGLSSLSLASQPTGASTCPSCLITYSSSQSGHQWTAHSHSDRSCAVRDQTCKTSSSRVRSSTQRGTQTSSGNLKINLGDNENPG